jgi:hypothetical protein
VNALASFYHTRKRHKRIHMEPKITIVKPNQHRSGYQAPDMKWVEGFSKLMDSKFLIPGTNIRFGIDPILSLIPVLGDLITYLISGMLIYTMRTQGASREVVIRMIINSTLDAVIGAIPLVGTVFDVFYRSNDRNVKLLKEHYLEGKHQGSGNGLLVAVAIFAILLVAAAFYGVWKLMEAIF